jgi:hypothetical protein
MTASASSPGSRASASRSGGNASTPTPGQGQARYARQCARFAVFNDISRHGSREAITLRREAVRLHRRERQVAPTQAQNDLRIQAPNNRNLSACSFRFNNRRGAIDVDVSDAMNESSLFVVQIRRLDVTYNHSNATCYRYIRLTMQNCHPV